MKLHFIAENKINWYSFLAFEWKINLIECLRSEYIANWIRDLKYGSCTIMLIFTKKLPLDIRAQDETEAIVTLSYRDWVCVHINDTMKFFRRKTFSLNYFSKFLSLEMDILLALTNLNCEFPQKSDRSAWNAGDLGLPLGNQIRK